MNKENKKLKEWLVKRFTIEKAKFDRSGIYALTQRAMAFNSNKIEGSTLTPEQTAALFDSGILLQSADFYRAKDVEEMNGHFLMFNTMLDTLDDQLDLTLIKKFHYELKSGVFEDRANGYAIGDFKTRANMVGIYQTTLPVDVPLEMAKLLEWYKQRPKTISVLAEFHAKYEIIHPFQDGNGRTGRMILFRESLLSEYTMPFIIQNKNRSRYINGLWEYREQRKTAILAKLFEEEITEYRKECDYFTNEI